MRTRFSRIPIERKFQHIWKLILENRNLFGGQRQYMSHTEQHPQHVWSTRHFPLLMQDREVWPDKDTSQGPWKSRQMSKPLPYNLVVSTSHFCFYVSFQLNQN